MSWTTKEVRSKIKRIKELSDLGFNTPRMIYIPYLSSVDKFDEVVNWAMKIYLSSPEQIFNIRTYKRTGQSESVQTIHLTDLSLDELYDNLLRTNVEFNCMIDAETPDNGRLAGNIAIENNDSFSVEFVVKEKRAMVRDINKESFFSVSGTKLKDKFSYSFPSPLNEDIIVAAIISHIIHKSFIINKRNIILEWTYFSKPSGIFFNDPEKPRPESHVVWWEYRIF